MSSKYRKPATKPLLVIINPASGTKVARKMFRTIVRVELDKRSLGYEAMETQHAGHAEHFVRTCHDLMDKYAGIVTVSGDGLIHEVYNGLFFRPDWDAASKMPIGIVPGGTGNALNCSLLRQLNQPLDGLNGLGATSSGLNVAVGLDMDKKLPLDLIEIELENGRKIVSVLGITIGLIADVDIGSEALRFLGYMRSYILVFMKLFCPKSYRVRVSYLPLETDGEGGVPVGVPVGSGRLDLPGFDEPVPADWVTLEGRFYLVYAINLSQLDPVTLFVPSSSVDDGKLHLVLVEESMTRLEMVQWFLSTRDAGHMDKTGVHVIPVRAFRIDPIRPAAGYMTVDAESVPFGRSQGQILPGKGRIFVSE